MTSAVGSNNVTLVCFGRHTPKELTYAHWSAKNVIFFSDKRKPHTRIYYKNCFYKRDLSTWYVNMSLIIQNVTLADSGNYTCAAKTLIGYDKAFVYLRVKEGMYEKYNIFNTFCLVRN